MIRTTSKFLFILQLHTYIEGMTVVYKKTFNLIKQAIIYYKMQLVIIFIIITIGYTFIYPLFDLYMRTTQIWLKCKKFNETYW